MAVSPSSDAISNQEKRDVQPGAQPGKFFGPVFISIYLLMMLKLVGMQRTAKSTFQLTRFCMRYRPSSCTKSAGVQPVKTVTAEVGSTSNSAAIGLDL